MKALSVREPFAWLIVHGNVLQPDGRRTGFKPVENRNFATSYRGSIYIHTGISRLWTIWPIEVSQLNQEAGQALIEADSHKEVFYGALIGEVDIVNCRRDSPSPWAEQGKWHWELANPTAYPMPIPYKGKLGLFVVTWP